MADASLRDYGPAAPYGPNPAGGHVATADPFEGVDPAQMSANEKAIFDHILLPEDSYDEQGVYWADMKIPRRAGFVTKQNNAEVAKELRQIGSMMKADPLSPLAWYARNAIIPGAGLLMEG